MADEAQNYERGVRARELLANPLFIQARDVVRARILAEWEATAPAQTTERELLHAQLIALQNVLFHLETVINTGNMAARILDRVELTKP